MRKILEKATLIVWIPVIVLPISSVLTAIYALVFYHKIKTDHE